jgi:hypothetical protein
MCVCSVDGNSTNSPRQQGLHRPSCDGTKGTDIIQQKLLLQTLNAQ